MPEPTDLPIKPFTSPKTFATWLAKHHAQSNGIWIKIAKKDSGIRSVTHAEALEVALCYGWIDGQRDRFDDEYFLQRFTPRRARSRWSKINRDKRDRVDRVGRDAARRPGRSRSSQGGRPLGRGVQLARRTIEIPEELARGFAQNAAARKFFETLDSRNRYAVLYRIENAKKAETRERLAKKFVEMLAKGETIHPRPERKR